MSSLFNKWLLFSGADEKPVSEAHWHEEYGASASARHSGDIGHRYPLNTPTYIAVMSSNPQQDFFPPKPMIDQVLAVKIY